MHDFLYLSFDLSIYPSIYLSISINMHLLISSSLPKGEFPFELALKGATLLTARKGFTTVCIYLSIYPSIYLSIYLYLYRHLLIPSSLPKGEFSFELALKGAILDGQEGVHDPLSIYIFISISISSSLCI